MRLDNLEELDEVRAKERAQEKRNSFLIDLENEIGRLSLDIQNYKEEQRTLERLCERIIEDRMKLERIYDRLKKRINA